MIRYDVNTCQTPMSAPIPQIDVAVTLAEMNLIRRLRQIRRNRIAREVLIEIQPMTLRLVSINTEAIDRT